MAGASKSYFRDRPSGSVWTAADVSKVIVNPLSSSGEITVTSKLVKQFKYNPGRTPSSIQKTIVHPYESGQTITVFASAWAGAVGDEEYYAQEGTGSTQTVSKVIVNPLSSSGEITITSSGKSGTCDGAGPGGGPEKNMGGAQDNNPPHTSASGYHDC